MKNRGQCLKTEKANKQTVPSTPKPILCEETTKVASVVSEIGSANCQSCSLHSFSKLREGDVCSYENGPFWNVLQDIRCNQQEKRGTQREYCDFPTQFSTQGEMTENNTLTRYKSSRRKMNCPHKIVSERKNCNNKR